MKINNNTHRETREVTRKPYQKPKIGRVQLIPEEAVLAACKTSLASGPDNPCNLPGDCLIQGS